MVIKSDELYFITTQSSYITDTLYNRPGGYMMEKVKSKYGSMSSFTHDYYQLLQLEMASLLESKSQKVLTFTAAKYCKEKSEYLCKLAQSMVMENNTVLIIDCNKDNNKIKRFFGIKIKELPSEGFIDVPNIPGLKFIPGGQGFIGEDGSLIIDKLKVFIKIAREEFDYILVDGPPVDSSIDGLKVAKLSDGVIIVVLSHKTQKASATRLNEILKAAKVNVLGVILGE